MNIDDTNDHIRNLINQEMEAHLDERDIDLSGADSPIDRDQWNDIGEELFIEIGNLSCALCPGDEYDPANDGTLVDKIRATLKSVLA